MKIKFGLEAQGHIPTVEKMLEDGRSWDEIAEAIGWVGGDTVKRFYDRHVARKASRPDATEVHHG